MLSNCGAEKTLESPLDCVEIKSVRPKGNQSWIFTGRTDTEAEAPILWSPDVKSWLTGKDPDVGKHWGQEKGGNRTWDGWMASLTQWIWVWAKPERYWRTGSLVCCSPWGCKELDMTEKLSLSCLWCYPAIPSSVTPFSSNPQSFPALGLFPMGWLFALGSQCIGATASASVLPMNIQGWFPLGLTGLIYLQSKSLLQDHNLKTSILWCSAFFMVQCSHLYMTTEKPLLWLYGSLLY